MPPSPIGPAISNKPRHVCIYKYHALLSLFIFYIQPLKMDLTEGSEMSANHNLTPGKYPKEHIQYSKLAKV
jgi:hypothetical protein